MRLRFTKMHGAGNDYIYVNGFEETVENPREIAQKLSPRHFGVGADGLVLILPSETCDFKMRMFNADGSEAQMCGNALRCIGKYVFERKMTDKTKLTVETLAGEKTLFLEVEGDNVTLVTVDMGEPVITPALIPMDYAGDSFISQPIEVDTQVYRSTAVSMGNPHNVVFLTDVDKLDLEHIGPYFENNRLFPERVNTEFVELAESGALYMRVWERGSGETMACGTGACASLVAACLNDFCLRGQTVKVIVRGGELLINWQEDGHVMMTGDADLVFEGEIEV